MNTFVLKNMNWLNPLLVVLTMICAFTIGLDISEEYTKTNPIKAGLFQWIINHTYIVFYPAAILLAYVLIVDFKSRKTIYELKTKLTEYEEISETISENIKDLFNGFLFTFSASTLGFKHTDRVTLYIHNGEDSFVPFGRASPNPEFAKKGRATYPDHEGCISKGWQEEWHFYNSSYNPVANEKDYLTEQKNIYSIDKATVRNIKMKSQQIAAYRIGDKNKHIGIIVIESLNPNRFEEDELKTILQDQHDYLIQMITTLNRYIATPSKAHQIEDL